jgi:hypothetical protein
MEAVSTTRRRRWLTGNNALAGPDGLAGFSALGVYAWPSLDRLPVTGTANLLPGDRLGLGATGIAP